MTTPPPAGPVTAQAPGPAEHPFTCTVWRDGGVCGAPQPVRFINTWACRACARRLGLAWPNGHITPGQRLRDERARTAAAMAQIRALLEATPGARP